MHRRPDSLPSPQDFRELIPNHTVFNAATFRDFEMIAESSETRQAVKVRLANL